MRTIAVILIGVLLAFNSASAGIKFIPKEGKLWIEANGEVGLLKPSDNKEQYLTLKLEDNSVYILTGEYANGLKKSLGKKVEIDGLLRGSREIDKKSIPSIEVKSVKEIK